MGNSPDNPFTRARTPFEKRTHAAISQGKPMVVGGAFLPLPGGTWMQLRRQTRRSSVVVHPFYIRPNWKLHTGVVYGLGLGAIPQLGDGPIGETGGALDPDDHGGNFYVYLKATVELTWSDHNFLMHASLAESDGLVIITDAAPLTVTITDDLAIAYRLIAQVIDGRVQRAQQTTTNLSLAVCDAGDGTEGGKNVQVNWGIA